MTQIPHPAPDDAGTRRAAPVQICYDIDAVPTAHPAVLGRGRSSLSLHQTLLVPPREGRCFEVDAGQYVRIVSIEGPQVGDLNLWNRHDLSERFFSGKTRQLHASHVSTGDRLWSTLPSLRPLATISCDTLDWYGTDADGGRVHDVIGTRCDPFTNRLLRDSDYHHCCHSNLTRALASHLGCSMQAAEPHIHDVLNVFMCTGFTREQGRYFMKASPVRPGDYLELFAETDLLCALSACPGGDCGSTHSSDDTPCYPLRVEVYRSASGNLADWSPAERNPYRHPLAADAGHHRQT